MQMNDASVGEATGAIAAGDDGGGPPPPSRLEWLRPFTTRFIDGVTSALQDLDVDAVDRVVATLAQARDHGHVIFVAGNGGSAATASHWVNDLAKATRSAGLPYVRAISLTDSTPWMTALANDEGYERVFAGQLENMAQPGDVLVVISASGNSPNLLAGRRIRARERGRDDRPPRLRRWTAPDDGRPSHLDRDAIGRLWAGGKRPQRRLRPRDLVPRPARVTISRPMSATCSATPGVIVAGGRGTRLRPLTDQRPKTMVEVGGKPFLDHLLEQLARAGTGGGAPPAWLSGGRHPRSCG